MASLSADARGLGGYASFPVKVYLESVRLRRACWNQWDFGGPTGVSGTSEDLAARAAPAR